MCPKLQISIFMPHLGSYGGAAQLTSPCFVIELGHAKKLKVIEQATD